VASTMDRWGWPVPWLAVRPGPWLVDCVDGWLVGWLVACGGVSGGLGFDGAPTPRSAGGVVAVDAALGVPAMGFTESS
jgi:hypothetical protein